ncbi:CUN076 hypothetical protein [Culex nigripalpus nucleopolyhedrovirus]|uniref:Uncharacterized protein n=1 Tax=Culex nigripalpus nucleopolyhedrovirus (isolate Florida/1997) TaxID=645993 RepID=Q919K0_NPVCO|nr:CUN076 hypothetical protein [Culex nigripalpus nucleopolyhedrovirus]AAK94154.1 CUN076 hypothetical protein [Culex nigripalpus nucleopolyhedrovirus]
MITVQFVAFERKGGRREYVASSRSPIKVPVQYLGGEHIGMVSMTLNNHNYGVIEVNKEQYLVVSSSKLPTEIPPNKRWPNADGSPRCVHLNGTTVIFFHLNNSHSEIGFN